MSLQQYIAALPGIETVRRTGRITDMTGLLIVSEGPAAAMGDFCEIDALSGPVRAQVVGFRDRRVLLMPLEETTGLQYRFGMPGPERFGCFRKSGWVLMGGGLQRKQRI